MSRLLHTSLNAGGAPPPEVVGGEGVYFILADGRRVLDGSNTAGALGHGHPVMSEIMRRAATAPVVSEGWRWRERDAAAERLMETAFADEQDWVGAVRFCLSGSEANDMALSLAQSLTGRGLLTTRERAYHGLVGLSRAMTVQPHWHGGLSVPGDRERRPSPVAPVHVLPADAWCHYGVDGRPIAPLEDWDSRLACEAEALKRSAAVIVDYTQGGVYYAAPYQDAVARGARAGGALWIADEVVTGIGRAGRWFGFQGGGERPDIVTLGKALGGGSVPVAAVVVSRRVMEALRGTSWQNYGTLRGHPMTVAAVGGYLDVVVREGVLERVRALESFYRETLVQIAARHRSVTRVAGQGLHWTIELAGPSWRTWQADEPGVPLASRVASRALELGAVIGTSGEQTSLFLAPSLIIDEAQSLRLLEILDASLDLADASLAKETA
ncbi:aminotransferase class III-fold pyridoxal phosphate-dependent enzyme [Gluconacetobacter sacchari]|uniref:aminotransferase class III-fold pyridoxal phosphate-dependent enzyme n=1 Tax=Gluconacetobacter sacchari TaxID=92759 RepID=UPI0039B53D5E